MRERSLPHNNREFKFLFLVGGRVLAYFLDNTLDSAAGLDTIQ